MIQNALDTILTNELTLKTSIICLITSLIFGILLAFLYKFFKNRQGYSIDIPLALIILPIGVNAVVMISRIMGLNSTIDKTALAFSFAGILCLTRFRSTQHDISDLTFMTTSIILGFIIGLGYILYALITLIIIILVIFIVTITKFNAPSIKEMQLKIIVPESLNFDNLFDDILEESCKAYNLKSIKSQEFGTMFELSYVLTLKDNINQHDFIDKIRERNGNLNVTLSVRRFNTQAIQ